MPARVDWTAMAVVNGKKDYQGIVDKGNENLQEHLLTRDPKLFREAQKRPWNNEATRILKNFEHTGAKGIESTQSLPP